MNPLAPLRHYIETEFQTLLRSVELYVLRSGLAMGEHAFPMAMDVLNETVLEALKNADRFDPLRQPRPWLIGIALNIIKRRKADRTKRTQREPLIHDLLGDSQMIQGEDDLFDRVAKLSETFVESELESEQEVSRLLAGVSDSDQYLLRLAIVHGLKGEALADALGVSSGTARVRLHRALHRLRLAHGVESS